LTHVQIAQVIKTNISGTWTKSNVQFTQIFVASGFHLEMFHYN